MNSDTLQARSAREESFNRYMVECEYKIGVDKCADKTVLIDTWWNVNKSGYHVFANVPKVLIDTWWNVNMYQARHHHLKATVLIDTWWNVNKDVFLC